MPMAAEAAGARVRLRASTRAAHARVDACFPHGLDDIAAYRCYLLGMQALVAALEAGLVRAGAGAEWAAWWQPSRREWLDRDLHALALQPLPAGAGLSIHGDAEAAGALYVLEGSAMGAAALLRDATALGFAAGHGARFLHGHGGDAGRRWRRFAACLDGAGFDEGGLRRMCDAAGRTFDHIHHAFQRAAQA